MLQSHMPDLRLGNINLSRRTGCIIIANGEELPYHARLDVMRAYIVWANLFCGPTSVIVTASSVEDAKAQGSFIFDVPDSAIFVEAY